MISSVRGNVVARMLDGVVLDVNGVGYRIQTTLRALRRGAAQGEVAVTCDVRTRSSYGFAEPAERGSSSTSSRSPAWAEGRVGDPLRVDAGGSPARDRRRTTRFVAPGIGKKTTPSASSSS